MIDNDILKTLNYKSVFNYPVSFYQLCNFLQTNRKVLKPNELEQGLKTLIKTKKVSIKGAKYSKKGIKTYSWDARMKNSYSMLNTNQRALSTIRTLPWVKMIGITGSVSAFNASKNDDLDVLIVCQKDRIWLTRLFVSIILILMGKYANKVHKNKICPNIYMDESELQWKPENQNIYVANDILQIYPWFYKDDIYFKFIAKNLWIKKHFGLFNINLPKKFVSTSHNSPILDKLENWVHKLQMFYMASKQTTEVTTKTFIHFNKNDNTSIVLKKLAEK